MAGASGQIYTFGVFRYDASTGELRRNGQNLKIPEQASRILGFLLENHGTLVTREALRAFLWPRGEHVDYDHSISNSISRLRAILRDDLRAPVYIATVSKRGYRFIAVVEIVALDGTATTTELSAPVPRDPDTYGEPTLPDASPAGGIVAAAPAVLPPVAVPVPFLRRYGLAIAAVLLVAIVAGIWSWSGWRRRSAATPDQNIYIGVAPFVVLGGERTLADSFRLDTADALSLLPGVRVKAANSFPEGPLDEAGIRRLGEEAHLDVILLTRFLQKGRDCTLEFELVRARDAVHLGSFHYTGSVDELSSIRDRIQREVFARLDLVRFATHPVSASTTDPRAYELYLRARYDLLQQTDESLTRAIEEFKTVTSIDPHFAKAYSGMANAYVILAEHDGMPIREGYHQAVLLARKAVEMEPDNAEAHALLGFASLGPDWNLEFAEKELRRAVELDPNSARYRLWLAVLFGEQARFDEGYRQVDLARAADPFWPLIYVSEAFIASSARDNGRMVEAGNKLVNLKPDWPEAYDELGWIYWYAGEPKKAAEQWQTMAKLDHDPSRIDLENRGLKMLAEGGTVAYARLRLKAIEESPNWKHIYHDFLLPEWYSCAGDRDAAILLLQQMVAKRDLSSLVIAVNPMYDSLRSDQRFKELLTRIYGPDDYAELQKRLDAQYRGKTMNLACPLAAEPGRVD
jgi:DNA-binding winged helix-turn-helix (wHTH) protein/tetratricopeptide (TPR) repeat protein